ncbi:YfhD family protein [Aquibacillus salsiterrae]|uniref:YfhD family protein n=1 Tax=Aquibacillus salsiterrae TaxID=2950439 RepID=A0A9X4AEN0_9BACI|nr:YfhD family protein [Aquibacillus salsiterrae]MDC3417112.1 YfhD family protein [Aquibacillus salsiterrae]
MAKNKSNKMADGKVEDVEFSYELADAEDLEARERMKKADARAEKSEVQKNR